MCFVADNIFQLIKPYLNETNILKWMKPEETDYANIPIFKLDWFFLACFSRIPFIYVWYQVYKMRKTAC